VKIIGRREVPVKRAQVQEWLADVQGRDPKQVIEARLQELGLEDTAVDMGDPHGVLPLSEIIALEFGLE
jgi:hypothetical protein